jgi:hypothetical protein
MAPLGFGRKKKIKPVPVVVIVGAGEGTGDITVAAKMAASSVDRIVAVGVSDEALAQLEPDQARLVRISQGDGEQNEDFIVRSAATVVKAAKLDGSAALVVPGSAPYHDLTALVAMAARAEGIAIRIMPGIGPFERSITKLVIRPNDGIVFAGTVEAARGAINLQDKLPIILGSASLASVEDLEKIGAWATGKYAVVVPVSGKPKPFQASRLAEAADQMTARSSIVLFSAEQLLSSDESHGEDVSNPSSVVMDIVGRINEASSSVEDAVGKVNEITDTLSGFGIDAGSVSQLKDVDDFFKGLKG